MNSLFILIPIAILLTAVAILFLLWAVKNDQYDDLESEAIKVLFDDTPDNTKKAREENSRK